MGLTEDRKSALVEKINKDISNFSFNFLEQKDTVVCIQKLRDRTSGTMSCGTKIINVIPFSEVEEKEFFNLYASVRNQLINCVDKSSFDKLLEDFICIQTILIYQHMPLVCSWLSINKGKSSHKRHLMSFEDKLSEGNKVLMRCVDKFDFSRGIKFSSYVFSALNNMVLKDVRDNKKRAKESGLSDFDIYSISDSSSDDSPAFCEIKEIWDDCIGGSGAANFLTDVERAIIHVDFSDSHTCMDQEGRAKTLNMNIETFRKKKRSALQKIKDTVINRIRR